LETEYGIQPEPAQVTAHPLDDPLDLGNFHDMINMEYLSLSFTHGGKSYSFPLRLLYPKNKFRVPYFVVLSFRSEPFDRYLPTEEIIDRGFGIALLHYNSVTMDKDEFESGIGPLSDRTQPNAPGKLALWAYAAMRTADYLLTRPETAPDNLAVVGHSRLGKTALLTGALDPRFQFVFSNDAGCCGDALFRGKVGEHIDQITSHFPHWFCPSFRAYAGKETELPFDQHALLAMIAPRHVMLGSSKLDTWADPVSQYLSLCAADPVFKLLGCSGFLHPDRLPVEGDRFAAGSTAFHLRSGIHFFYRTDWTSYMDFRSAASK
jgi:hypothetical protein